MNKRILLFDIDGTLTTSSKSVERDVFLQTLTEVYNVQIEKKDIVYSGGTDRLIWKWLLNANGIEYGDTEEEIEAIFNVYKRKIKEGITAGHWEWTILKNVNELLTRCSKEDDLILALLTGNMIETAEVKLSNAGVIFDVFKMNYDGGNKLVGAFGSDNMDRPTIVKLAMNRFNEIFNTVIPKENFLIIGDTPKDVLCGHKNGIAAVGVATGIYSADHLRTVADYVLDDFGDIDSSIKAFRETKFSSTEGKNYDIKITTAEAL